MSNQYYVYRWIRLDTNTPFHVGKGKGDRFKQTKSGRNKYFRRIVTKVPCDVEIILKGLSEEQALSKETEFIKLYKCLGYCETNIADGGNASSSLFWTKERREAMSVKKTGSQGPNKGRKFSEEFCIKQSEIKKGKHLGALSPCAKPIQDN